MSEDFERLAPQLERAIDPSCGYTLDDVRAAVESGKMQLWPGQTSAIVTQVLERPQGRALFFFLAAGDMDEVQRLYKIVIAWGYSKGCKYAAFVGRRGWSKSFLTREEGWKAKQVVYEKEIR